MARKRGPIQVWAREDSIPTDEQGGYAGGDSVAETARNHRAYLDRLAERGLA